MKLRNLLRWPLYPWLLALYAPLFLFSRNVGELIPAEVVIIVAIILLSVTGLFGLAYVATRRLYTAGALTSLLVVVFFTYGHIHNLISPLFTLPVNLMIPYVLGTVLGIGMSLRAKESRAFERPVLSLNIVAVALVLMTLPPIVSYFYRSAAGNPPVREPRPDHPRLNDSPERPDIYYIILDAYPSNAPLLRDYGYDNSAFTDALEARGFFVAYESMSNYGLTVVSLASSLNLRYIDEADMQAAQQAHTPAHYYRDLTADNAVAEELQEHGYTYIFMLSGFASRSTLADVNIDFYPTGSVAYDVSQSTARSWGYQRPFLPILMETTALRSLASLMYAFPSLTDTSYPYWHPQRALMTWSEAEKIAQMPEATFTIVHLVKPHSPLSFDRNGNVISESPYDAPVDDLERMYFEQLHFVNIRTLQMIDAILEKSSTPPIILLQGDHGSDLGHVNTPYEFEILNAYHLPGRPHCIDDPSITPVNSFRALLNCYFGADYPLLEPRFYAIPDGYFGGFLMESVDIDKWEATLRDTGPLYQDDMP